MGKKYIILDSDEVLFAGDAKVKYADYAMLAETVNNDEALCKVKVLSKDNMLGLIQYTEEFGNHTIKDQWTLMGVNIADNTGGGVPVCTID